MIPVSRLISSEISLASSPGLSTGVSGCLILGSSDTIPVAERVHNYSNFDEVKAAFDKTSNEYSAAKLFFQQAPSPVNLKIGRWASSGSNAMIIGNSLTPVDKNIAILNQATNAFFSICLVSATGVKHYLTAVNINLSTAVNLNAVASKMTTALNSVAESLHLGSPFKISYSSSMNRFEIRCSVAQDSLTVPYPQLIRMFNPTGTADVNPVKNTTLIVTLNESIPKNYTITFIESGATNGDFNPNGINNYSANVVIATSVADTYALIATLLGKIGLVANITDEVGGVFTTDSPTVISGDSNIIHVRDYVHRNLGNTLRLTRYDATTPTTPLFTILPYYTSEDILNALVDCDHRFGREWYGLVVTNEDDSISTIDDDAHVSRNLSIANYIEAISTNKHIFAISSMDPIIPDGATADTTSISYQLSPNGLREPDGYNRSFCQYSSTNMYAGVSLLGRLLTTDFNQNNSVVSVMWKDEPGIIPENLSIEEVDRIELNNCNVFTQYDNRVAIIERGTTGAGWYIEDVIGIDWLAIAIQNALFHLLYSSPNRIPQDNTGVGQLVAEVEKVLARAVKNGVISQGVWYGNPVGELGTGSLLRKGYYIYSDALSSQSNTNRQLGVAPPIYIAVNRSGSIRSVNSIITVNP